MPARRHCTEEVTKELIDNTIEKILTFPEHGRAFMFCISNMWTKEHMTAESSKEFIKDHINCIIARKQWNFEQAKNCPLNFLSVDQRAIYLNKYKIYLKPCLQSRPTFPIPDESEQLFNIQPFGFFNKVSWRNVPVVTPNRNQMIATTEGRQTHVFWFPRNDVQFFENWFGTPARIVTGVDHSFISVEMVASLKLFADLENETHRYMIAGEERRSRLVVNTFIALNKEHGIKYPIKLIVSEKEELKDNLIIASKVFNF